MSPRKSKPTSPAERTREVVALLRAGVSLHSACRSCGIARETAQKHGGLRLQRAIDAGRAGRRFDPEARRAAMCDLVCVGWSVRRLAAAFGVSIGLVSKLTNQGPK